MRSASARSRPITPVHEADGRDHVEVGAGQRAVGKGQPSLAAVDGAAVQRERGHVGADRRHRVGDEEYPGRSALGAQRDRDGRRIDMDAVGDQPGPQRFRVDRGSDQARLAVADLAHRVEQMRDHGGAGFGRRRREAVGRVGMAEADDDAGRQRAPRCAADRRSRARRSSAGPASCGAPRSGPRHRLRSSGGSGPGRARPCGSSTDADLRDAGRGTPAASAAPPRRRQRPSAAVISGVSVISVASSAVVPNGACAAQMVRIVSTSGRSLSMTPAAAIDLQVDEAGHQHAIVDLDEGRARLEVLQRQDALDRIARNDERGLVMPLLAVERCGRR